MKADNKTCLANDLLLYLKQGIEHNEAISSREIADSLNIAHDTVIGILKSLESKEQVILELKSDTYWSLTSEGSNYALNGTPESILLKYIRQKGLTEVTVDHIKTCCTEDVATIGVGAAVKQKLISVSNKKIILLPDGLSKENDCVMEVLCALQVLEKKGDNTSTDVNALLKRWNMVTKDLSTRKLIEPKTMKWYMVKKGMNFGQSYDAILLKDLTKEVLQTNQWKELDLKPYNFNAGGIRPSGGSIHPLMQMMKTFKDVLFLMGFEEMPTRNWIESSFWNFDALFQPQNHPARDSQDTFFLKTPEYCNKSLLPKLFVEKVKEMHESGDHESRGWQYAWSLDEASKNVLRTHTTACTAHLLYSLAEKFKQGKLTQEMRFFSIDRVFRNESVDATHLAEFHQVEGVVCGYKLSLAHLKGILLTFYEKIGISELKFKPTFNPYTEPSMEIYGYHPIAKKWIEVGNSGVFRPEMLKPLGFPSCIHVLGWGLSLERPTMIRYKIDDIRKLFGHKSILGL